jgi:hypothetical protein
MKSFPDPRTQQQNAGPLIRILFIAIGPMVWNAAVLLVLFLTSLFLVRCWSLAALNSGLSWLRSRIFWAFLDRSRSSSSS